MYVQQTKTCYLRTFKVQTIYQWVDSKVPIKPAPCRKQGHTFMRQGGPGRDMTLVTGY